MNAVVMNLVTNHFQMKTKWEVMCTTKTQTIHLSINEKSYILFYFNSAMIDHYLFLAWIL